jgi:membrane protease YdiL (CAAX protease family)
MDERLQPRDYRLILICAAVCALGLWIGIKYFYRAFPEASIEFQFTKDTSLPVAERFLAAQGISTRDYRHASAFRYDDEAKVFLERELGLEKANALMGRELKLWRWGHRWFKPLQKEEVRVEITTRGEVGSFFHALPEDAPGADLPADAARAIAESFLALEIGQPLDRLEYIDSQTQKRPHRTDHLFTWKASGLTLRDASYRVSVTVQGDRVDGYSEYLKIPEAWSRDYARLRSLNDSTTQVDALLLALLGVAMLFTLGRRIRMKDIRWHTALVFAAITSVLQFLASLNEFPLAQYDFDTTSSYESFLGQSAAMAAIAALAFGGIIFLLTACAEPVYRENYPAHVSISRMLSWESVRTRGFFRAALVGVTLTLFFFAYEIGFYLLANRFGAWSPAEIPYTDLLNTKFPWVFVLLGGFFPAVSEEWIFRAFSIPFLQKLLRYRWLAIALASFIWGFGHSNYPNQPFFIRGIEVGVVGLVLSWAMIRFGIVAPLIAHYSIDAFYSAFLFLRSGNPYLVTTGAVTAGINLIPLLVAVVAYLATGRFRSATEVSNREETGAAPAQVEPAPPEEAAGVEYLPLSKTRVACALAVLILGVLLLFLRPPRFGDFIRFRQSAPAAAKSAQEFLAGVGFDAGGYRSTTQPIDRTDEEAVQYIYGVAGIEGLNTAYGKLTSAQAWATRFYRPLQKEEFRVATDPASGRPISFHHLLAEETPGADLKELRAQQIASSFLESRGYELSGFELKEVKSEKPRQRRDTNLVWEARAGSPGAIAEARLRIMADVQGDRIGGWTQFIKIPEEWRRARERQTFYSIVALTLRTVFIAALLAFAMLVLIRGIRQGHIRWRLAMQTAAAALILDLLDRVNSIPEILSRYDTEWGMRTFALSALSSGLVRLIGVGLAAGLAAGIGMACYPDLLAALRRSRSRPWLRDSLAAAAASLGTLMILQWIVAQIEYRAGKFALAPPLAVPQNLGTYLPAISSIRDALLATLFLITTVGLVLHLWARATGRLWQRALLLAGLIGSLLPASARRPSEVGLDLLPSLLLIALICFLAVSFLRRNYLAYLLSTATICFYRISVPFLAQGNPALSAQGCALLALLAILLCLFYRGTRRSFAPSS